MITSVDVRTNPNYAGGLIGFVLLKDLGQTDALARLLLRVPAATFGARAARCPATGRWRSATCRRRTPNAYYLAFEDWEGADQNSWQGNDGDFNDKVFKISGVTCDGGGEPCDTGMPGVCARGVTQCQVGAGITLQARGHKSRRKVRQPRQRLQRHRRRRRRALHAAQLRLQQGCLHPQVRRQRVPLRGRPQVRHRRPVQGSALRRPTTARRARSARRAPASAAARA